MNSSERPLILSVRLGALVICAAGLAAYSNSLGGPFVFDDPSSIVDNATIRHLWRLDQVLSPPVGWGATVSGRPILNLSLAINYAISGPDVWSYHALNLLIHLLAGLTLFGVVRRTLLRPVCAPELRARSTLLAFVVALGWTLHPLQTESVTYVIQRAESLMGLFFFLTLYAFIRWVSSGYRRAWGAAGVAFCLLGVGTKEVAALAPILVFLYDRAFVSGTLSSAWKRHRRFYAALFATWLPLLMLISRTGGNRGGTVGFNVGMPLVDFWLTQFEAVARYLRLSVWPHPLVFEYGRITPGGFLQLLPWALPVLVGVAGTVVALWRWPAFGFLGAWFFGILAPTSIVPGTVQFIVEHRTYLPLAAVVVLVVIALARCISDRSLVTVAAFVALALGATTYARNKVYATNRALWIDTLAKRPGNALAHNNLGATDYAEGHLAAAIAHYRESLRLYNGDAHARYNLGIALVETGELEAGIREFQQAVEIIPHFYNAHLNLGTCLTKVGRAEEALPHFAAALHYYPTVPDGHLRWGLALSELKRWGEAAGHFARALELNPASAEAEANWGVALSHSGDVEGSIAHLERALRLKRDLPDVHFNLALALAASGRVAEAIREYQQAVQINPDHAEAQLNLGIALGQTGDVPAALKHLRQAVRLRPASAAMHTNLAIALIDSRQPEEALAEYETALRLDPDDPHAHYNVGYALVVAGRWSEAEKEFEAALRLRPDFPAATDMLRHLRGNPR